MQTPTSVIYTAIFGLAAMSAYIASLALINTIFGRLSEKFPKYYKAIGSPVITLLMSDDKLLAGMQRRVYGELFMVKVLFGLPKAFPNDTDLRRRVSTVRYVLYAGILCLLTAFCLLLYASLN